MLQTHVLGISSWLVSIRKANSHFDQPIEMQKAFSCWESTFKLTYIQI